MRASARISAWVTPAKRATFQALAKDRGLSDSKLVSQLIDAVLRESARSKADKDAVTEEHEFASTRMTVRLRPTHAVAIARRAAARDLRPATYLALLVHAHVMGEPPIPRAEILELKRAVGSLSAVGRNLNQLVAAAHRGRGVDVETRAILRPIEVGVDKVRQAVRAHAEGNLVSWSIPDA